MRLRHTAAAVAAASAVLFTATAAMAAVGADGRASVTTRISVSQETEVGYADVTVRPVPGGWDIAADVTKTTVTEGCLTLAGGDEDPLPAPLPLLAAGDELGEHCGEASTTTRVTGHTTREHLVLRWDGEDGLPPAASSVHVADLG
jgi:hypothetical protein